jgi:putative transposase
MPRMYPASVRRQIVSRLRSGEPVAAVAVDTGICQATLFRWKRQALIDAGVVEGVPSVEAYELAVAHKRIAVLEAELALTRDACDLFDNQAVVPPKRRRAIAEGLIARGHSARSARRITGLARSAAIPSPPTGARPSDPPLDRGRHDHRNPPTFTRHLRAPARPRRTAGRLRHERQPQTGRLDHDRARPLRAATARAPSDQPDPHQHPSDLVNRHFTATRPNELWCTDITEHPARDGKVYCCAILDCFSP